MNRIAVSSAAISGKAAPPPSKSAAHRALICAALACGGSVSGVIESDDMHATLGAIESLGVRAVYDGNTVTFYKTEVPQGNLTVDCMESGSTLRFLIPVFAARGIECTFVGRGRLPQRPLGVYADCLPGHGVSLSTGDGLPLSISGRLEAGRYELPGDVSSQFISGLMFALPLCDGDSEIRLTTRLESSAYVDLTIDALKAAGIEITPLQGGWSIPGGQNYRPCDFTVEGDWSQAAFLLAMGALGGEITLTGVDLQSHQGDRAVLELMRRFGADIRQTKGGILCKKSGLHGIDIDATQIPDLVPILATVGAFAKGVTNITGAARLRLKESDRLEAVSHCLKLLGAKAEQTADGLRIEGVSKLRGGAVLPGYNDHRIVMSMAVAALQCDAPVTIEDADSVKKSWPEFFEDYKECGGKADVI